MSTSVETSQLLGFRAREVRIVVVHTTSLFPCVLSMHIQVYICVYICYLSTINIHICINIALYRKVKIGSTLSFCQLASISFTVSSLFWGGLFFFAPVKPILSFQGSWRINVPLNMSLPSRVGRHTEDVAPHFSS